MAPDSLLHRIADHKRGMPVGIYSVCSAHSSVLKAAMTQAMADRSSLLIGGSRCGRREGDDAGQRCHRNQPESHPLHMGVSFRKSLLRPDS